MVFKRGISFLLLYLCSFYHLLAEAPCYEKLSLEEKVGQLLVAFFPGDEVNEYAKKLIQEACLGGVVYYRKSNGLQSAEKVEKLSDDLQDLALSRGLPPLFLAVDQEGGVVVTLQEDFTDFPGNRAVARTGDSKYAYRAAFLTGKELKKVGVNVNLAPVVDVNSNPLNPIIGVRSFGETPDVVVTFGMEAVNGYLDAGIIPSLKHFPGHGDVTIDSHESLPVIEKTFEQLKKVELEPFNQLASLAPVVMTGHLFLPHLDSKNCATFSSFIVSDLLRKQIGFEGVVITDSLTMGAIGEEKISLGEAAIRAFLAGHDLLLIGGRDLLCETDKDNHVNEVIQTHRALVLAVKEGRISEKRLDESLKRILKLKNSFNLLEQRSSTKFEEENERLKERSLLLAKEIAEKSILLKKGEFSPAFAEKILVIAPEILRWRLSKTSFFSGQSVKAFYYEGLSPKEDDEEQILSLVSEYELVVCCLYNGWKFKGQLELAEKVAKSKSTLCLVSSSPTDGDLLKLPQFVVLTFSPSSFSLEAALQLIKRRN